MDTGEQKTSRRPETTMRVQKDFIMLVINIYSYKGEEMATGKNRW